MNSKTASLVLFVCVLAPCLMVSLPLHAQVSGATISGTITDATGAVIAGAEISVRNTDTGIIRNTTADTAGFYTVPNLNPGPYEVKVSAKGFNTAVQSNLTLTVGAQQQLNIPMKVGETSQTVQVTEAAPQIELTSSALSGQIQAQEVRELPLNGRDWTSLATLSPGVNALETQQPFEAGALRGNRGFGAQLTISGGRPTQNNYRLDGLSINDYGNAGPGSVIGGNLGVDAIQEFSVITGNYSAEYGKTSGGIVNAISKSGTNAFHGDVYEFFRNAKLDANDFYSNAAGVPKPAYRRNQFGASAGGPIRKNRTFLFGDFEGIRQAQGVPSANSHVPSAFAREGILSGCAGGTGTYPNCSTVTATNPTGACPANATKLAPNASVCVDNNAAKYLAIYPLANGGETGDVGNFVFAPLRVVHENFVTTRLDHKISDKDGLFVTYMYDDSPFHAPDGFDQTLITNEVTRHIAALEWNHAFTPTLLNTARLGYNRDAVINNQTVGAINPAAADPSLSMMPGYDIPAMIVSGWSRTSPGLPGPFTHFNWNSIQFYDDAFWTRGTHALKFGFALENMRYNPFNLYLPNALLRFNGNASTVNGRVDFLTNQPDSIEGGLPVGVSPEGYRQTLFGGYLQDDWRLRHNLTLNVGLRYEMLTVVTEQNGKLTSLRNISDPLPYCGTSAPTATDIVFGVAGCAGVAPYYSNPTTRDFEPRIGFAWDPRGDGKTSVRGGFAIFDVLPLPGNWFSQKWAPIFLSGKVSNTAVLAGTLGILPGTSTNPNPSSAYANFFGKKATPGCTSPLGTCSLGTSYVDPNPKRNYVEQWNINVQRQITPSLTATVGYVGSHGVHMLIRGDDFDMVPSCPPSCPSGTTQIPGRYIWPVKGTKVNPDFGFIRGIKWNTDSTYKAFQFSVQKTMSHGFQFGGSYTYSKSMDDDSATVLGDAFSNSITTWFWFAPKISRAVSDYNFTHTAIINATWQVPGPRAGLGQAVLGGWEVGGIFKRNSGVPTTPLIDGDPMGVQNGGSDTFGIPDLIPGCDPINHNYKNTPGLIYIKTACYTPPVAPAAIASDLTKCTPYKNTTVANTCMQLLGNAGRNSIVGPPLTNLDFSLHKNIPVRKISESASVQFRAEFFNVLNHPNFGVPLPFTGASNAIIFGADGSANGSPAGGLQQPLVTLPRDIQFALKLIW